MNQLFLRSYRAFSRYAGELVLGTMFIFLIAWAIWGVLSLGGCGHPAEGQPGPTPLWPVASSTQSQQDLAVWLNQHGDIEQLNIVGLPETLITALPVTKSEIPGQRHPRFGIVYNEDDTTNLLPLWCSWDGSSWANCGFGGSRRVHWNAGEVDTRTPCALVTEARDGGPPLGGPLQTLISCSSVADAIIDAEVDLPKASSELTVRGKLFTVENDTTGSLSVEAQCMCLGEGDELEEAYNFPSSDIIIFAGGEEYIKQHFEISGLTCTGPCIADDTLHLQFLISATGGFPIEDIRFENFNTDY